MTSVERTMRIAAPPELVWEAVTDEHSLSAWFGGDCRLDVRPGGRGRFTGPAGEIRLAAVDEVEPNRHLAWRWWPLGASPLEAGTVRLDLEVSDDATVVTVREEAPGQRPVLRVLAGVGSG